MVVVNCSPARSSSKFEKCAAGVDASGKSRYFVQTNRGDLFQHGDMETRSENLVIKNKLVILLGFAGALCGCGKASETLPLPSARSEFAGASTSSIDGVALPRPLRDLVAIAPPADRHHYDIESDGEYGYRQVIGAAERSAGVETAPLVRVRYKGVHKGIYVAELRQSTNGVTRMECKKPCQSVRLTFVVDGEVLDSTTVPATGGNLIATILDDMQHGRLHVYSPRGAHAHRMTHPT